MVDVPPNGTPTLSEEERADVADLSREVPALRRQLAELEVLLQQNAQERESQRVRADNAGTALQQMEQGGSFTREQYQQVVTKAHQSQLRFLSVQHQQELLEGKRQLLQQLVDLAEFALRLATRLDPASLTPASAARPAPRAPVAREEHLPPPSESAIIEAQEQERRWIAQQLHNGPAQALTNLILRAEICERLIASDPQAVQSELHALRETVHRTLQDMRRFIFDVRPMILDDLGLVPALRRFVDDWNSQAEHTRVTLNIIGPDRRFRPAKELAAFRIVQDAIKTPEGGGTQPTAVQILLDGDALRLTVETAAPGPAGGTADYHTIQQRAAVVGGTVGLESRAGTRVLKVSIPLDEESQPAA